MMEVSVCHDLNEARGLWLRHWPRRCLFDLWPVRVCFQSQFNYEPYFLVATRKGRFAGMLALSWIEEHGYFGHFPGETWQGKTWLEQNRIIAADAEVLNALLDHIPAGAHIRYLERPPGSSGGYLQAVDEVGFLFYPQAVGCSFSNYLACFSGKSRKKIRRELERLGAPGVAFRYDCLTDLDHLFRLNRESFEDSSYFYDRRLLQAFKQLSAWLKANNLLRITTVLIGGEIAAVDMGAVWNKTYTLLAGGANPDFPGVAKLINLHHIEWACQQALAEVDFLCGDFNWKSRFHLTPRPLYKLRGLPAADHQPALTAERNLVRAL